MTSETLTAEPFISGLFFGECPRWHDGRLWFSDFFDHAVFSVSPEGDRRVEVDFDGEPAGLGWLPDGRLLINSRLDRAVMRREEDGTIVRHGTLTPWATWHANDMVVAANGQAYAGNFGFDLDGLYDGSLPASAIRSTSIVRVDPDGSSCEAASDLAFPNGAVITADGATLIVAESMGGRLTAFDRAADGTLGNRREWAAPARRRPRRHLPVRGRHGLGGQRPGARVRPGRRGRRGPRARAHLAELLRLHAGRRRPADPLPRHRARQPRRQGEGGPQRRHREGADERPRRRAPLRPSPSGLGRLPERSSPAS